VWSSGPGLELVVCHDRDGVSRCVPGIFGDAETAGSPEIAGSGTRTADASRATEADHPDACTDAGTQPFIWTGLLSCPFWVRPLLDWLMSQSFLRMGILKYTIFIIELNSIIAVT